MKRREMGLVLVAGTDVKRRFVFLEKERKNNAARIHSCAVYAPTVYTWQADDA